MQENNGTMADNHYVENNGTMTDNLIHNLN
jgi:hypothetical protein